MYAAPIWSTALECKNKLAIMEKPLRRIALRVACSYSTVSLQAILVVSGVPPVDLLARERAQNHNNRGDKDRVKLRMTARAELLKGWQKRWDEADTGRWTRRLIRDVEAWTTRSHGGLNFHVTQMLTGHGCFSEYLHRFKRKDDPKCVDCLAPRDDAEHAIFRCDRWWKQRRELEVRIDRAFEPEAVVDAMLASQENWNAVGDFVNHILSRREEEERARQRADRNYIIL